LVGEIIRPQMAGSSSISRSTLRLDLEEAVAGVHPTFFNARELKIRDLASFLGMIDIEDIASSGWEDIRYKVSDSEGDCLSFYCQNFEANFGDDS
jgi:hypothetical protein